MSSGPPTGAVVSTSERRRGCRNPQCRASDSSCVLSQRLLACEWPCPVKRRSVRVIGSVRAWGTVGRSRRRRLAAPLSVLGVSAAGGELGGRGEGDAAGGREAGSPC